MNHDPFFDCDTDPFADCDGKEADCTGYWLTPSGYAALVATSPRRLTRKRRLVPALAAKRTRGIHPLSTRSTH